MSDSNYCMQGSKEEEVFTLGNSCGWPQVPELSAVEKRLFP